MIAAYSLAFPGYQKYRGQLAWTRFYLPSLMIVVAVPLFMMTGVVRPAAGNHPQRRTRRQGCARTS